jgi:hypothetical protein
VGAADECGGSGSPARDSTSTRQADRPTDGERGSPGRHQGVGAEEERGGHRHQRFPDVFEERVVAVGGDLRQAGRGFGHLDGENFRFGRDGHGYFTAWFRPAWMD